MKTVFALAALIAFCTSAQAKLAPVADDIVNPAPDVAAIFTGPAGAMLEHDYFSQPAQPFAARRIFPCTMRLVVFEKTRIAQACE